MPDFQNKTAIVTGAAGGMGYEISRQLVAKGAMVHMIDAKPAPNLPNDPGSAHFHQGDLTDVEFVSGLISDLSSVDFLVNVAGVLWFGRDQAAVDMDLDLWDQIMQINLKSMVITQKFAIPKMIEAGGGAIVNFSTIQCLRGDTHPQDAYQASKAGVIALTKSTAIQFAAKGIRANSILPGPTTSPMQDRWLDNPDQKSATEQAIPLGRTGTVEDMANACLFLLSDKASFITGTELIIDGGLTALP